MIHGNPTSSYSFRNVIPYLTEDARVISIDFLNHGRSDHSFGMKFLAHLASVKQFIRKCKLKNITLLVHHW